jgi:hypothetical protein
MDILASPRLFLIGEGRMQTNEEAAADARRPSPNPQQFPF